MEQNGTNTNTKSDRSLKLTGDQVLKIQQDQAVTYMALGGLITVESDDPSKPQDIHQMTVTEFLEKTGIPRTTFYRWKQIPGIGEKIRERRNEIFSLNRETVLFNRAYLIAMTSKDHKAAGEMIKMLLGNSAKLELPIQRQEIKNEGASWLSFVQQKQQNAIEADIIDDPQIKQMNDEA